MMSIAQAITTCGELIQLRAVDEGFWDSISDLVARIDQKVDEADLMCGVFRSYGILEKSALSPKMVSIADCLAACCRDTALKADVSFSGKVGEQRFFLDRAAFSRIFANLVRNVIEHCGKDATLHIHVGKDDTVTSDLLTVDFRDDGPGIASKYWDAIFEPGERAGKDLDYREGGGLGLGLSISKSLAVSHKYGEIAGDLRLFDSCSSGSVFRLTIPGECE
jgi:signal transduction histidine kinase